MEWVSVAVGDLLKYRQKSWSCEEEEEEEELSFETAKMGGG